MPSVFPRTIGGRRDFLRAIIDAADGVAAAVKFNLAFFETHGADGWRLMEDVRATVPEGLAVIADGKRGDIASSAKEYASAIYARLDADAATVNPLMGRDAVDPFLQWDDRLTYVLALTSNPSASDLLEGDLSARISAKTGEWSARCDGTNAGLVIGATRPTRIAELRRVSGRLAALVPGVGAQGGGVAQTIAGSACEGDELGDVLIHVTRSVLPTDEDAPTMDAFATAVRGKIETLNREAAAARASREHTQKEGGAP